MSNRDNPQETSQRTPETLAKNIINGIDDYTDTITFRKKVREIFEECIGTTNFKDKIKAYAGESFNDKLFKNGWAIALFFGSLVIAGIVGRLFT